MKLLPGRRTTLPDPVERGLDLGRGDRPIAWAIDDNTDVHVIATTLHIASVAADGTQRVKRPWHLVDAGQWNADTWTLSVTWIDKARAAQWSFREQDTRLPEAFRERVQATVVVSEPLGLTGARRSGRVVLRRDLSTQDLLVQPVLGRGTPADDPEVQAEVARISAYLKEQAGL
ncbi:hypothetical protein [Luteipulveratus mongoliensis]|uniref:Uncharacterized protein n=1 Tax=Luteipulveratus mongoliensis TaxID=571913 RepID=A0A0K1JJ14_9MICO|nr:hypothetical protein [Luteipulveratus mongoliensis]AKU16585.1 hypothetical protein VV02_13150 [Luteipulveratus mongoliensis]